VEVEGVAVARCLDGKANRVLMKVDHGAGCFLADPLQRGTQGRATGTSRTSEDIAREAMTVHANQHGVGTIVHITANQSQV